MRDRLAGPKGHERRPNTDEGQENGELAGHDRSRDKGMWRPRKLAMARKNGRDSGRGGGNLNKRKTGKYLGFREDGGRVGLQTVKIRACSGGWGGIEG